MREAGINILGGYKVSRRVEFARYVFCTSVDVVTRVMDVWSPDVLVLFSRLLSFVLGWLLALAFEICIHSLSPRESPESKIDDVGRPAFLLGKRGYRRKTTRRTPASANLDPSKVHCSYRPAKVSPCVTAYSTPSTSSFLPTLPGKPNGYRCSLDLVVEILYCCNCRDYMRYTGNLLHQSFTGIHYQCKVVAGPTDRLATTAGAS